MAKLYITQAGALALQAAGLPGWTNLKADLVSAAPAPPDRQAAIGDFTLGAWTGYAQASPVLTGGWVEGNNGPVYATSSALAWHGSTAADGVDVVGFILQDGTSHAIWAWGGFDTALPMRLSTDHLEMIFQLFEDESATILVLS